MSARPNLIFIVADDLGYADLGCYGGRAAEFGPVSPVLDAMAAAGLRFTQGYANSPVCSPTRFALMTARWQYRLRGAAEEPINSKSRGSSTLGLPPEHPTLPSLLKDGGYRTALIGKWHLGYPPAFGPLASGYEEFFGPMSGGVDYFTHADSSGRHDLYEGAAERARRRLPDRPDHAARAGLGAAHGRRQAPVLPEPALHRAALALGDARRPRAGAQPEGQPVPPGRRQHPRLPPHDPPHGRRHRPAARRAAPARPARQHAGGLHQRQRRRAFLRQLAAGRRQDGPDRRRHPRALHRALAGRHRTRPRERTALPDDGLVGDAARRGRCGGRTPTTRWTACH